VNALVLLPPVVSTLIAFSFALQLARRWRARRRGHALAWALSLSLFGLASLAAGIGVGFGWSQPVFGTYWVAGALLNVPLLAVGQLLLLDRKRALLWWSAAALFGVWSVVSTLTASYDAGVLAHASATSTIPLGREVLAGSAAYALARPFSFTFVVVVIGSIWSSVRSRRPQVLLIALGVTVVAGSSSAVRVGNGELFSLLLIVGVSLMYAGFLAASRPPKAARGRGRGAAAESA